MPGTGPGAGCQKECGSSEKAERQNQDWRNGTDTQEPADARDQCSSIPIAQGEQVKIYHHSIPKIWSIKSWNWDRWQGTVTKGSQRGTSSPSLMQTQWVYTPHRTVMEQPCVPAVTEGCRCAGERGRSGTYILLQRIGKTEKNNIFEDKVLEALLACLLEVGPHDQVGTSLGHKRVVRQGRVLSLEGVRLWDSHQTHEPRQWVRATGLELLKQLRCLDSWSRAGDAHRGSLDQGTLVVWIHPSRDVAWRDITPLCQWDAVTPPQTPPAKTPCS